MSGYQHRRTPWLAAAVTLAFLTVGTSPAFAHKHPTPIERAAPGVVYIEARAKVEVALIEHRQVGDSFGVHIGIQPSTWNPVLGTASGFVVDPTGAIVTTGSITRQNLERAWVYAVNQAFHKQYGDAAPLPQDPFAINRLGASGDRNEERLRACYPPGKTNDAGGCVVRVTPDYVVYPYVTSQKRYGGLHAQVLPGGTKDVAVLRVPGANSMPTVAVGTSTAGAHALGVLGFTGKPDSAHRLVVINQHLTTEGATTLKSTGLDAQDTRDAAQLAAALSQGMAGGPVLAEGGQVVGLLPTAPASGSTAPPLVTISSVLPILAKAGVSPHSGPVDINFVNAMHQFKNGGYAASVPGFTKALELFPGHALAAQNLAIAKRHLASGNAAPPAAQATGGGAVAGAPGAGAADTTSSGTNWLWLLGLLVVVALLATAAVLLVRRRRSGGAGQPAAGPTGGRPTSAGRHPPGSPGAGGVPPAAGAAASGAAAAAGGRGPGSPQRSQHQQSNVQAPPQQKSPSPRPQPPQSPQPVRAGHGPNVSRSASAVAAPDAAARGAAASVQNPSQAAVAVPTAGQEPRFCTACGGRLAAQHQFCGWCGEPVG